MYSRIVETGTCLNNLKINHQEICIATIGGQMIQRPNIHFGISTDLVVPSDCFTFGQCHSGHQRPSNSIINCASAKLFFISKGRPKSRYNTRRDMDRELQGQLMNC